MCKYDLKYIIYVNSTHVISYAVNRNFLYTFVISLDTDLQRQSYNIKLSNFSFFKNIAVIDTTNAV